MRGADTNKIVVVINTPDNRSQGVYPPETTSAGKDVTESVAKKPISKLGPVCKDLDVSVSWRSWQLDFCANYRRVRHH
jgi:hypothetical protein